MDAQQFPVGAVLRIVVVVVVAVVNGQLAQALAGKLAGTAATHVGVHAQSLVAVTHFAVALGVGEDAIQLRGIGGCGRAHGVTWFVFCCRQCGQSSASRADQAFSFSAIQIVCRVPLLP